ncbi:hypothetical protein HMPREF0973_00493 [Prevotella veroralis F0319]|uniref:Uncharacterized protein n=1 Tax=Prevotella veroralis F0319 TaxID=649761 RepID=C9MLL8_9BACT|nr:hypothetical protein HMPREF0973_00493 [Prevotella veroralis F0319]
MRTDEGVCPYFVVLSSYVKSTIYSPLHSERGRERGFSSPWGRLGRVSNRGRLSLLCGIVSDISM